MRGKGREESRGSNVKKKCKELYRIFKPWRRGKKKCKKVIGGGNGKERE